MSTEIDYLAKVAAERTKGEWQYSDGDLFARHVMIAEGMRIRDGEFIALYGTCADEIATVFWAAANFGRSHVLGDEFILRRAVDALKSKIRAAMPAGGEAKP